MADSVATTSVYPSEEVKAQPVVLLVDDDSAALALMAARLNRLCLGILSAKNGEKALEVLRMEPSIALAVTDVDMPVMDGLELLRRIRQSESFADLPVILCSGNHDAATIQNASELGGTRYLVTPIHAELLLEQIMAALCAAWAHSLSDEAIRNIATGYCVSSDELKGKSLEEIYHDVFDTEELPNLNKKQKLFVVAEDIPPGVARVCRFLRSNHGLDISCISVSAHKTKSDEILISTNFVVGQEDLISVGDTTPKEDRWSDPKSVKEVVREAVDEMTKGNPSVIFTPKEVAEHIHKQYPTFNPATVRCQLTSDCVNHTSRKHYPGGQDRLWLVERGKFRLFNPAKDQISEP